MIIPKEVQELIDLFNKHHQKLYIVGGAVRDSLLNKVPYDYDFATTALPNELLEILDGYKTDPYQIAMGSIKVLINNHLYEITTLRKESGLSGVRYPKDIEFTDSIELDSNRRDFSINALYYDGKVYDFHQGIDDLNNHLIRFIGDPKVRINEDPVRILRGIRHACALHFQIETNTLKNMKEYSYLIGNLGIIKYQEILKILSLEKQEIIKYLDILSNFDKDINLLNILNSNDPISEYLLIISNDIFNSLIMDKEIRSKIKKIRNKKD